MAWMGIDLGGTKIYAVRFDDGEVVAEGKRKTPRQGGPLAVVDAMADLIGDLGGHAGLSGVGVGAPGVVDAESGTVRQAPNLAGWMEPFPVGAALSDALDGLPVEVDNDVNVGTFAELRLGAGKGVDDLLGVFVGTGVGAGVVLDGVLRRGLSGAAGEIGHMVVKSDGRKCPCGRVGCMEAYAGRGAMELRAREKVADGEKTVLFEIMEEKGKPRLASGIWERALEREDKLAHHLIKQAVDALGVGIASALNLLDVEAVVIGGGLGLRLGDPYVERIRAAMMPHLFADHRPPDVLLASLGDLGGAIGATLLAAERAPLAHS